MNSIRAIMLSKIKEKIGDHSSWVNLEANVAMMCADLPEPDDDIKTKNFVGNLRTIKEYLLSMKLDEGSLKFIDDEIKQYQDTKLISVYEDDDEDLDDEIVELYARLGDGKEGVFGIPHQLNYQQLSKLTMGVFKKTGLIKYYISKEKIIYGKIVAEIYEHAQKIPVATLIETKKKNKDTGESEQKIVNFGQPYDKGKYNLIKEVSTDLYVYRLITLDSTEMILLSPNKCEIGDYILEGTQTYSTDYRALTESARITTKLPFFIAQSVKNRVIKFKDHEEFFEKVNELGITKQNFFEYPFTIKKGNKAYKLLQPEWYKYMIWAWLLHQSKGLFNNYPMHLMIVGPKHCLPKGTLIQTPKGLQPIESVTSVFSVDYNCEKRLSIPEVVTTGIQEVWEINTSLGTYECSENHEWFVLRDGIVSLSKTKDLKTTDSLLNIHGKEMRTMSKTFQSISVEHRQKKILQSKMLRESIQQNTISRQEPSMEELGCARNCPEIQSGKFNPKDKQTDETKSRSSEKKVNQQRNKDKVSTRTTVNNKTEISSDLGRYNEWEEESCIQTWKNYWAEEKQSSLSQDSKGKSSLGMRVLQGKENKQKVRSDSSPHNRRQQRQSLGESDDSLPIMSFEITSITQTNRKVEMYDLIVPGNNNFILADGTITHNSGKSLQLNGLHATCQESRSIFSGSSSTLKHLIPSFKYNPARLGYLAESNRFSYCDEFLRCLVNTPTSKDGAQREESVALMNDLLEHQKREAGSGVSRVNVNMTARVIATTNPIRGIRTVGDLVKQLDESFLSRWMIYYQLPEHVAMIRHSDDSSLKEFNFKIYNNDWISLIDYLHSFSAIYDMEKVKEIHEKVPQILNENLNKHYDARHKHHIECLMDGIVKTRCFLESDKSFEAKDEDYEILKKVWFTLIKSWITPEMVRSIPIFERIYYIPDRAQQIYWHVVNKKQILLTRDVKDFFQSVMPLKEFIDSWNLLIKNGLLVETGEKVRPHYMKEEF